MGGVYSHTSIRTQIDLEGERQHTSIIAGHRVPERLEGISNPISQHLLVMGWFK